MAYTYTERKRIRKNFGNRDSVLEIPYLLQMQKDAYTAFLQADVAPKKRTVEGLQAAFEAAFPIVSHNGFVEMKYLEYSLAKPAFDVRECQTRGLTFASAVRAKVQLIIYDRESSTYPKQGGQGSEGAGSLHGRSAADDGQGFLHHQRH
jgi:DNA-directed RNA polymerase subunit beta